MKKMMMLFAGVGLLLWVVPAQADMKMIKAYKEAYPDAKPKCIECHVVALPKKADGEHEMNDYGKAVIAQATKEAAAKAEVMPTADTFKKVGPIETFKK